MVALARFIRRRSPQHRFLMLKAVRPPEATQRIPRMTDDDVTVPMPIIP